MSKFTKTTKIERLRGRLFYQYRRQDYASAARLGEALLKAHTNLYNGKNTAYADDLYNTALANASAGHIDRAIELYTESIHRHFEMRGADLIVAARMSNLGALLSNYGQHEAACRIFVQALTIRKRMLHCKHVELADSLYNMGNALIKAARQREAIPALTSAMHIYTRVDSDNLIPCLQTLAAAHQALEEYDKAIPYAEAAWRSLALSDIDEHYRAAYALAFLYEEAGLADDACQLYLSIMEWIGQKVGYKHSSYVYIATKAASMLAKLNEYEQAKSILQRLKKLVEEMVGRGNLTYSNCTRNLAVVHRHLEEWDEAERLLLESIAIKESIIGGQAVEDSMLLEDIYSSREPFGK